MSILSRASKTLGCLGIAIGCIGGMTSEAAWAGPPISDVFVIKFAMNCTSSQGIIHDCYHGGTVGARVSNGMSFSAPWHGNYSTGSPASWEGMATDELLGVNYGGVPYFNMLIIMNEEDSTSVLTVTVKDANRVSLLYPAGTGGVPLASFDNRYVGPDADPYFEGADADIANTDNPYFPHGGCYFYAGMENCVKRYDPNPYASRCFPTYTGNPEAGQCVINFVVPRTAVSETHVITLEVTYKGNLTRQISMTFKGTGAL